MGATLNGVYVIHIRVHILRERGIVLQRQLMNIWQESQKTTIFITHSVDEALVLGDRLLVMTARPGKVKRIIDVELGRPRDIIALREDRQFIKLYSEVWRLLADEVEYSAAPAGRV